MNRLRITLSLILPLSLSAVVACDAEVDSDVGERALSPMDYELQSQLEEFTDAELECTDWLDVEADETASLSCGEWTPVGATPLPVDEGFRGLCNYWQEIFNGFADCPDGGNLQTQWRRDCVQCAGDPAPSCGGWYIYSQETECAIG